VAFVDDRQPIINGTACAEGEEPTTVGILVDMKLQSNFFGTVAVQTLVCTGTLIAPDTVMAAAHCVDEKTLGSMAGVPATVKDAKFSITFQRDLTELVEAAGSGGSVTFPADAIAVRKAVPNPDFTLEVTTPGPSKTNDTAVLFLDRTADVAPEVVVTREEAAQLAVGKAVKIAGYGQQTVTSSQFQPPPPGTVGIQMCVETNLNELGTYEMQIGSGRESGRKCQGDSGGPTFMTVETATNNKRRVIGITSHSYDQTNCNKGGVDVRVDAYLDWLDAEMTKACIDGTRVWCDVPGVVPPEFWEPPAPGGSAGDAEKGCGCDAAGQVGLAGLAALLRRRKR
jgi:secreted trypsin-like serine protease